jgi:hypothetical protein
MLNQSRGGRPPRDQPVPVKRPNITELIMQGKIPAEFDDVPIAVLQEKLDKWYATVEAKRAKDPFGLEDGDPRNYRNKRN